MFYLYLKQHGEGCDYTIGCGARLFQLRGPTLKDAEEDAKQYFDGENYGYGRGDYILNRAYIFKLEMDAMPILNKILADEELERKKEKESRDLAAKRAQFEQLKKELGES